MTPTRFELTTQLSVEECLERLRRSTSPYPLFWFWMPAERTFYCKITGHRARLFTLGPGQLYNSFMPFLHVTFEETPEGTVLHGRLRPHPFVLVLLVAYLAIALSMAAFLTWAVVTGEGTFSVPPVVAIPIPLGMAGLGIVVALVGVASGRPQETELLRFIRATLEAE